MSNKKPEIDAKAQKKKEETAPEQPKIEFEEDDYFEEFYEGNFINLIKKATKIKLLSK